LEELPNRTSRLEAKMMQSSSIGEKAETIVFQSLTLNLAATVCDQLERAGFPARLGKVKSGFAVLVPSELASTSSQLLTVRPRTGEIFS
jgi:hypothetical protein